MREESSSASLWSSGEAYERYVGRWSRPIALEFLRWLEVDDGSRWLDVGCGTGALTQIILESSAPRSVNGVDPSEAFVAFARQRIRDQRAEFAIASAEHLAVTGTQFDAVVSGLVLNFVPDPSRAVSEFARVLRHGGVAGAYVWDYGDGMQMMRRFWDAAIELDPSAAELDEANRFTICNPDALSHLWNSAGMNEVETRAIEIETRFTDFDDYWRPFLAGRAPAPAYAMSLSEDGRAALRDRLQERLVPDSDDGTIRLRARAWAVRGTV